MEDNMNVSWHEKLSYATSIFIVADLVGAGLLMHFTILDDVTSLLIGVVIGVVALIVFGR